jgi:hypothetical protein
MWESKRHLTTLPCDQQGRLEHIQGFTKDRYPNAVYFVQADSGGPVKIGTGRTPGIPQRLAALQTGNPYRLVVRRLVAGDDRLERRLHDFFQSYRMVGEWFIPSGDLVEIATCIPGDDDRSLMRGCFEAGYRAAEREVFWRGYRYGQHELARQLLPKLNDCDVRDGDDAPTDPSGPSHAFMAWSDLDDWTLSP